MMTRYALLYERLGETVVAHYANNGTLAIHHFEYIEAPMNEAQKTMVAQGWQYRNTPGPQSVLMQHT